MQLNAKMMEICDELNTEFVNNDPNFKYANGHTDMDLLQDDKLHLSQKGTNRLISNLGLTEFVKSANPKLRSMDGSHASGSTSNNPANGNNAANLSDPYYFHGHRNELSNFYPCKLDIGGHVFESSEAAYQYQKAVEHGDQRKADLIKSSTTGLHAMNLAKDIHTSDVWRNKKSDIMMNILEEKAQQCEHFRRKLTATGTAKLVEDTDHEYWGRGKDHQGENMLGTLLMLLRQRLQWKNPHRRKGCDYCGELNHTTQRCFHGQPILCNICGQYGHKEKWHHH